MRSKGRVTRALKKEQEKELKSCWSQLKRKRRRMILLVLNEDEDGAESKIRPEAGPEAVE